MAADSEHIELAIASLSTQAGDPEEIGVWISETKAQRLKAESDLRQATTKATMTRQQTQALIEGCADISAGLRDAEPGDMAVAYRKLGLRVTCHQKSNS